MKKSHQNKKKDHLSFHSKWNITWSYASNPYFTGVVWASWAALANRGRGCVLPVFYGALWFSEQAAAASWQKSAGGCPTPQDYVLILTCLVIWGTWKCSAWAVLLLDHMGALATKRLLPAFVCSLFFLVPLPTGSVGWGMQDRKVSQGALRQ